MRNESINKEEESKNCRSFYTGVGVYSKEELRDYWACICEALKAGDELKAEQALEDAEDLKELNQAIAMYEGKVKDAVEAGDLLKAKSERKFLNKIKASYAPKMGDNEPKTENFRLIWNFGIIKIQFIFYGTGPFPFDVCVQVYNKADSIFCDHEFFIFSLDKLEPKLTELLENNGIFKCEFLVVSTEIQSPFNTEITPDVEKRLEDKVGKLLEDKTWQKIHVLDVAKTKSHALHFASMHGNAAAVSLLLENKASVDQIANGSTPLYGLTPLYLAAEKGHFDIIKLLLIRDADPDKLCMEGYFARHCETALHIASHYGYENVVRELLKHGADTDATDEFNAFENKNGFGFTPLHRAAQNGHATTVKALLQYNADPNILCNRRHTPLYLAIQNGHTDVVRVFLAHPQTNRVSDMLFFAALNGRAAVVREFILAGVSIHTGIFSTARKLVGLARKHDVLKPMNELIASKEVNKDGEIFVSASDIARVIHGETSETFKLFKMKAAAATTLLGLRQFRNTLFSSIGSRDVTKMIARMVVFPNGPRR